MLGLKGGKSFFLTRLPYPSPRACAGGRTQPQLIVCHSWRCPEMRRNSRNLKTMAIIGLSCIFALIGIQRGRSVQADYLCLRPDCNAMKPRANSQDCSGGNYNFDMSSGAVIYCSISSGNVCTLKSPIQSNSCTGYCANNPTYACTNNWAVCWNPQTP